MDAEVDDPLERWEDEDDVPDTNMADATQSIESLHIAGDAIVLEHGEHQITSDNSGTPLMHDPTVILDGGHRTPSVTTTPDVVSRVMPSASLLERRNAAGTEQGVRLPSESYLRPVTPTQSSMENESAGQDHSRTPTTEMLNGDGPMTPTNNAGPFVFDGSAGRTSGRIATESLPEDASAVA